MKILLLTHTGSVTGGAEQCLLEYTDVLSNKGYTCKVIVPYKGEMTKTLTEKGISWTTVGYGWATIPHRKVHPYKLMISAGNALVRVFQEVEKYKPDVIVTNTAVIPWGLYAGRAFNIPNVLLAHEVLSDKDPSLNIAPNYQGYGRILSQNVDHIIFNSRFVKNEFASVLSLPESSQSILYPLPPLDETNINHFFKENIIDSKIKIAIFGALSPRKNQLEALQAAKLLVDKNNRNFILDLYGDLTANPSYVKVLRRFIRDHSLADYVKIKGFATNVYEVMNEYNVVLSTSKNEPFGRTLIEGQLFGRVVITDDTGGGLELVQDLNTGLVYESGKPEQLAEKITWIMNNQKQALMLGNNAKAEQYNKYVTPARYDILINAIKDVTKNKAVSNTVKLYDPMMALFQYNHYLNNKYKHLYRLTHNRVTYPIKNVASRVLSKTKKTIKQFF